MYVEALIYKSTLGISMKPSCFKITKVDLKAITQNQNNLYAAHIYYNYKAYTCKKILFFYNNVL